MVAGTIGGTLLLLLSPAYSMHFATGPNGLVVRLRVDGVGGILEERGVAASPTSSPSAVRAVGNCTAHPPGVGYIAYDPLLMPDEMA